MKPFAGIIRDVKGRLPWYKSDWTEGFNSGYRCALHHRIRPSSSSDGAPRCYLGRKQTGNVVAHAIDDADTTGTTDTVRVLATAHDAGCGCLRPHSPQSCARVCNILQYEQSTLRAPAAKGAGSVSPCSAAYSGNAGKTHARLVVDVSM